ncbi:beta-N-acetylglucosaminidase domain-containing protein [Mycoplasma sp. 246B]
MKIKRKLKLFLGASGSLGLLAGVAAASAGTPTQQGQSQTTSTTSSVSDQQGQTTTYKITPYVHSISYSTDTTNSAKRTFLVTREVNLVFENGIDSVTRAKYETIFKDKGLKYSVSRRFVKGKTNILVGIHGDSDVLVDNKLSDLSNNLPYGDNLWLQTDAYWISTLKDGYVSVLAKNTNAAFYAATTLAEVFKQLNGYEIEKFTIKDYADIKMRGTLDDFKESQWSQQDRLDYFAWASKYKLNTYLYAASDDLKHSSQWKLLYTPGELANIKELATTGESTKVRFVYTINPFNQGDFTADTYNSDLASLESKIWQLATAGIKRIALNASNDANLNTRILNDLTSWIKEKVVTAFSDFDASTLFLVSNTEYQDYYNLLPKEIEIVKLPKSKAAEVASNVSDFVNKANRGVSLLLNWPTTQKYEDQGNMVLGGLSTYLPSITNNQSLTKGLDGIIVKPMQAKLASRIALFETANYGWKVWQSSNDAWVQSFNYLLNDSDLESKDAQALRTIALRLFDNPYSATNTVANTDSVALESHANKFKQTYNTKAFNLYEVYTLQDELTNLTDAVDLLKISTATKTKAFFSEIKPWANMLKDLSTAANHLIDAAVDIKANKYDDALNAFTLGVNLYKSAIESHQYNYDGVAVEVNAGNKVLKPFIQWLIPVVNHELHKSLGDVPRNQEVITNLQNKDSKSDVKWVLQKNNQRVLIYGNQTGSVPLDMKNKYFGTLFDKPIQFRELWLRYAGYENSNVKDHFDNAKIQVLYADDVDYASDLDVTTYTAEKRQNTEERNTNIIDLTKKTIKESSWHSIDGENASVATVTGIQSSVRKVIKLTKPIDDVIGVRIKNVSNTTNNDEFRLLEFLVNPQTDINDLQKLNYNFYNNSTDYLSGVDTSKLKNPTSTIKTELEKLTDDNFSTTETFGTENAKDLDQIIFKLDKLSEVSAVAFQQDINNTNKGFPLIQVKYYDSATSTWKNFGKGYDNSYIKAQSSEDAKAEYYETYGYAKTQYISLVSRATNSEQGNNPLKLAGLQIYGPNEAVEGVHYYPFTVMKYTSDQSINDIVNPDSDTVTKLTTSVTASGGSGTNNVSNNNNSNNVDYSGDYVDVNFDRHSAISSIHFVQGDNFLDKYIVQGYVNDTFTTLSTIQNSTGDDVIKITDTKKYNGIRIKPTTGFTAKPSWDIKHLFITPLENPVTTAYIYHSYNVNTDKLLSSYNNDTFKLFAKEGNTVSVKVKDKSGFGLDLQKIYTLKDVKFASALPEYLISQASTDGVIWFNLYNSTQLTDKPVRYIRLQYSKDLYDNSDFGLGETKTDTTSKDIYFSGMTVTVKDFDRFGRIVDSDLEASNIENNYGGFDGDFDTSTKFISTPKANNEVVYDLGSDIDLTSLKIYANNNSYNYPRDLEVLVAQTNDKNTEWKSLFEIGNDPNNLEDILARTNSGTIDTEHPRFKWWGVDNLTDTKARYVKLLIKKDYPVNRLLEINEIQVNGGKYYSKTDPRFSGTNYQAASVEHEPAAMLDADYTTYWEPKEETGELYYNVADTNWKDKNLMVVSTGQPSDAVVYQITYNILDGKYEYKRLGTLFNNIVTFSLYKPETYLQGINSANLVGFKIKWSGKKPKIVQFNPYVITGEVADKTAINKLKSSYEIQNDTNNRTKESKDAYVNAEHALKQLIDSMDKATEPAKNTRAKRAAATTDTTDTQKDAKAEENIQRVTRQALQRYVDKYVDALYFPTIKATANVDAEKYTIKIPVPFPTYAKVSSATYLQYLLNGYVNPALYTKTSYQPYQDAVNEAKLALANPNNLTTSVTNAMINQLMKTKEALVKLPTFNKQIAQLNVAKFDLLNPIEYQYPSFNDLKTHVESIRSKVNTSSDSTTEDNYKQLNEQFDTKYAALEESTVGAKIKEYEAYRDAHSYPFNDKYQLKFPALSNQLLTEVQNDDNIVYSQYITADKVQEALDSLKAVTESVINERNLAIAKYKLLLLDPISNDNNVWTDASYREYQAVLDRIASNVSGSKIDLLSQAQINQDEANLKETAKALVVNSTNLDDAKTLAKALIAKLDDKSNYLARVDATNNSSELTRIIEHLQEEYSFQEWSKYTDAVNAVNKDLPKLLQESKKAALQNLLAKAFTKTDVDKVASQLTALLDKQNQVTTLNQDIDTLIAGLASQALKNTYSNSLTALNAQYDAMVNGLQSTDKLDNLAQPTLDALAALKVKVNDANQTSKAISEEIKDLTPDIKQSILDDVNNATNNDLLAKELTIAQKLSFNYLLNLVSQQVDQIKDAASKESFKNELKDATTKEQLLQIRKKIADVQEQADKEAQKPAPESKPEQPTTPQKPKDENPKVVTTSNNKGAIAAIVVLLVLAAVLVAASVFVFKKKSKKKDN